ncbi:MAG: alpha/beta fold hydrolase [Actinomycetia bacterium]|nr:alpha/beta fold hydrolase [Actinomycetes bacterium]
MVAVRRFGNGPPLIGLHGFTFTGEQFASVADQLHRTVFAPDLPGHGRSVNVSTQLDDVIDAIESTIASFEEPVPLLGYSQGGRLALLTALCQPEGISALVLISANAGIEDTNERASRTESDARLAEKISNMTIDEFLDTWTATGITSTSQLSDKDRGADRAIRRENSPIGLANALIGYGQGAQPSLWTKLDRLAMPVLIMSGGRDEKYSTIADKMMSSIPDGERVTVVHAGHNPLLDEPAEAHQAISDFLDRHS